MDNSEDSNEHLSCKSSHKLKPIKKAKQAMINVK